MEARVDDQGRVILPPKLAERLGLEPGQMLTVEPTDQGAMVRWPVTRLRKLYIEPTSLCNIACRTCIRNVWDEPMGRMSADTFAQVLDGLRAISPVPSVFFGGYGEPLSHPDIIPWLHEVRALGARTELISNATLLDEAMGRALIESGLDTLWVSLDGATPDAYTDVRLGATLPQVLENLRRFRDQRPGFPHPSPEIGVVFVAMRRNIGELPALLQLVRELGATRFMISNVLPHTPEMRDEVLYSRALSNDAYYPLPGSPQLYFPKMDTAAFDHTVLGEMFDAWGVSFGTHDSPGTRDRCPFIDKGAFAVGWDGSVSPCLPLLHSHANYLHGYERVCRRHVLGSVNDTALLDLWRDAEHVAFRQRVQDFDFSPCTYCDGCPLSEKNEDDCYGNSFPTCGGCLWAQGVVQCP